MYSGITIGRLTHDDIPFGMNLKQIAGWNQLPLDWERFLEFDPQGCLLARCDGAPAGTATAIAYEKLFGWVGMVLVHPGLRRRGLGTALLMAGIDYLEQAGVAAVKLDATPLGKQLYDTIGFVDEYLLERWQGVGDSEPCPDGLTELGLEHLETLCALDAPIFGADRRRVLRRLLTEPTIRTVGYFGKHGLEGYAALRPGQNAIYLGPWVALSPEVGLLLWEWARCTCGPRQVFVDILLPNTYARPMVDQSGFIKQRELIRMYRGTNTSPGRPELQYGIFGPEVG